MNIILQQADIKAAVRLYIERQGIHLHNKTLEIDFAMGRGANGLSATLSIEDIGLPVFTHEAAVVTGTDKVTGQTGPSEAVNAMLTGAPVTDDRRVTKAPTATAGKADPVILPGGGLVGTLTGTADVAAPITIVDDVVEIPVTAPASKVAVLEVATAAVATPATEAAKAEPIAEAKTAEVEQAQVAVAAPAKASTSLFG